MRLPRDLDASDLVRVLARLGYQPTHQTGSHIRLVSIQAGGHSITVPNHRPLKVGTLNAILRDLAEHHNFSRQVLISTLFE
ncbi:MAG: type II toxin-antitoxin system HicA family toxin [Phycisphaeraceae bacterium]|nr:type II toxin-antitoxin system HicA family toxin [Phycisphaeraceae bacterium]MBX3407033.1 type II toxin-antitoxin system HicA family toxin [Phycisphaeraceae bacterium]